MNQSQMMSLFVSDKIQSLSIDRLKPHPRNEEVYGSSESIADLVESIKLKGYIQPLIVKTDGTIISGHRRWRALSALGWQEVPVKMCHFETEEDELFVLVAENRHRQYKPIQKIREGMIVEPIARKLRNSHATQKNRLTVEDPLQPHSNPQNNSMENFPLHALDLGLSEKDMTLTENIVAAVVGLGCGRNYRKGRNAVKAADELKPEHPELAQLLLDIINDCSIDAGYQIAKMAKDKCIATLKVIASGAAKTPKQAKLLIKSNLHKSALAEGEKNHPHSSNSTNDNRDRNSESQAEVPNQFLVDTSTNQPAPKQYCTALTVGSWVFINIPHVPKQITPERKWNGFWGKITEVGTTLKVNMGLDIILLLPSDVKLIKELTPNFCQVAERILRLQSFETVHEFGKVILNGMQQISSWDAATLAYLDAVEQIELARRALKQAL